MTSKQDYTISHSESTATMSDVDTDAQEIADAEIRAVRQRLKAAVKREIRQQIGDEPTSQLGFWRSSATQWDVAKFLLGLFVPLILLLIGWGINVQLALAKTDARFDAITATLVQQSDTLKQVNLTLKEMSDSRLTSRERLASIEAKVDILTQRSEKQ